MSLNTKDKIENNFALSVNLQMEVISVP